MSLNGTLSTAGRSLEVFSAGVQVTGENIANSSTPGYIREEIILETGGSYSNGNLLFGIGVLGQGVQQQIDLYLEGRLYSATTDAAAQATAGCWVPNGRRDYRRRLPRQG